MSHGITDQDRAAYANKAAWHGLGEVKDHLMSREEASEVLGWEPQLVGLVGIHDDDIVFDEFQGVIRSDTKTPLGVVGAGWTLISNRECIDFICDTTRAGNLGDSRIESVASLFGGKRVFVTANLGEWELDRMAVRQPDLYKSYLASITAHDGSLAWYAFFTDIRVVCHNTVQAALHAAEGNHNANMFRIKHTMNAKSRIEMASRIAAEHTRYQTGLAEELASLEKQRIHAREVRDWAATTLVESEEKMTLVQAIEKVEASYNPKKQTERETPMDRLQEDTAQITRLFSEGVGNIGATKYDALNGLTEWLDHQRSRYKRAKEVNDWRSKCLVDTMVGDSSQTKRRAMRLLKRW